VITGIGVISAMGTGRDAFWQSCRTASSGLKRVTAFNTDGLASNIAGWVDEFDPRAFMSPRTYRRMGRISRLAVSASLEALKDSGLDLRQVKKERIAIILGTAYGSSSTVEDFFVSFLKDGPRGAQPLLFPETVPNAAASHIAMVSGITGPNTTFCQNEISAETALVYARQLLLQNTADVVLACGADELSAMQYACYDALGALNKTRTVDDGATAEPMPGGGLVLGEGAGCLVVERSDVAIRRSARVYGKLASALISGAPAPMGHYNTAGRQLGLTMRGAMQQAGVSCDDIDQIDVSANFSAELDRIEYGQLKTIFAHRIDHLWVTPLKYLMGDFGGAGIIRAAAILLSLYHQLSLPALDVKALIAEGRQVPEWRAARTGSYQTTLMTSSTFGGGCCGLIFTAS